MTMVLHGKKPVLRFAQDDNFIESRTLFRDSDSL
jgi:hypothetical protein